MPKVKVSASISIDGFGAGPQQSLENPQGVGGLALAEWVFATRTFQRMHGEEAVAGPEDRLRPVRAGVERQHKAALLDRPVDLHVLVLVHAGVAHGGDHEAADVLAVAEFLDLAQRFVGIIASIQRCPSWTSR